MVASLCCALLACHEAAAQMACLSLLCLPEEHWSFLALQAGEHGSQRRSRSAWILAIPCIAAAGLGTWQVQRRSWKMDLIEQRAAALQASPAGWGLPGGCAASARAATAWSWLLCMHLEWLNTF